MESPVKGQGCLRGERRRPWEEKHDGRRPSGGNGDADLPRLVLGGVDAALWPPEFAGAMPDSIDELRL